MKVTKPILTAVLFASAMAAQATSPANGEAKTFNCMDKTTFAINSDCMSQKIESNLVFKAAEKEVMDDIANASDRAMATITFYPETMTISVVGHKDATIAKVDTNKQK